MNRIIEIAGLVALIAIWAAFVIYIILRKSKKKRQRKHEVKRNSDSGISYCPRCGSVLYRKNIVCRGYLVKVWLCGVCGYADEVE